MSRQPGLHRVSIVPQEQKATWFGDDSCLEGRSGVATYENGFVGLLTLGLGCAKDDAEGVREQDSCVGWWTSMLVSSLLSVYILLLAIMVMALSRA